MKVLDAQVLVCATVLLQIANLAFAQVRAVEADGFDRPGTVVTINPTEIQCEPGETIVISVTYQIPRNRYQDRESDFLGFGLEQTDINSGEHFELGETYYPAGEPMNGRYVYSDEVTLSAPLTVPQAKAPGSYEITVYAEYQLCDENGFCLIPQRVSQSLTVEVLASRK